MKQEFFFLKGDAAPDPLWEFEPSLHYRPRIYKSDFFRLTGYWLNDTLFPKTPEMMKNWSNGLAWALRLSYGQKAMFYWATLDGQVSNGGFVQFYDNGYARYIPTILKGLAYIGEEKVAAMIRKAHALYLEDEDMTDEGVEDDLFGNDFYEQMDELSLLDNEYYKVSYGVFGVWNNYVRTHPDEFCFDEDGKKIDPLLTGDFQCYHGDGSIRDAFSIDKGRLVGQFKRYYPGGQLLENLWYDNGCFTGEKEEFYETGFLRCRTERVGYKDWIRQEWFFEDGRTERVEHRTRDITNLPRQFIYYPSLYEEGVRIGAYKEWYRNGRLKKSCTHLGNYKYIGKYRAYRENGTFDYEIEYDKAGEEVSRCFSPRPSPDDLVQICLTTDDLEIVKETAQQLYYHESDPYISLDELLSKIEALNVAILSEKEKARLKIIIQETRLTEGINRRSIIGKYYEEVKQDTAYFKALADRAKKILDQLLLWAAVLLSHSI